jgi:hypothetical protein
MKDARGLLLHTIETGRTQTEMRLRDIAFDDLKVARVALAQPGDARKLVSRAAQPRRLHEQKEAAVFPCEPFEEAVGNESGKPGDEKCLSIRHGVNRV